MENRRLKRYDSAPLPAGSAAAAAAKAGAAHISNVPRPQAPPCASPPSPSPTGAAVGVAAAVPYETQLENYYRCMEEDNDSLVKLYETHTADIAALRVLAQERRFKDVVFATTEARAAAVNAFLKELADILGTGRGLRLRTTGNSTSAAAAAKPATAVSMDDVRDAVQKQRHALDAARATEAKHVKLIRSLEKDVAALRAKAQRRLSTAQSDGGSASADDGDGCCLPGSAKDLRDAQRRIRELERQLAAATREVKDAAAAAVKVEQQRAVDAQTLRRRDDELAAMRHLLATKERLIATLEAGQGQRSAQAETSHSSTGYSRTHSAPAAAPHQRQHRGGGETSSDRLVSTHHYRLLAGQTYVDAHDFSPESFKDAVLRSVSTLLHIPYGYLASVEVRTHAEAVSVEFDARHSSRISEDEIDFLLLSHDYPEVMTFVGKAKAALASRTPVDHHAKRIRELEAALAEAVAEADRLRRAARSLESSLDRRDADRAALDTDTEAALRETEATVTELYEALQAAQSEVEGHKKALALKSTQLRVSERAKDAALDAATAAAEAAKAEVAALQEQLAAAHAAVEQARLDATQQALKQHAEERAELLVSNFSFVVELPTMSMQRTARRLLGEAQQARVLQTLLLGHAARMGGAVPVAARRCAVRDGGGGGGGDTGTGGAAAALEAVVELAFYANKKDADRVTAELTEKLREGTSSAILEHLRVCSDAARREAAAAADALRAVSEAEQRAAAAVAATREEAQQEHTAHRAATTGQLHEIHARVSSVVPGGTADISSLVERLDQLLSRLAAAESAARRHEEDSRRAARRLADAQQEREQLQRTLSDLTARSTEVRVAKEQLATRVAAAEDELQSQHASAAEAAGVLSAKVTRLEAALKAKMASADAEKARVVEEHRAAAAVASARLAEAEEALATCQSELAQLQAQATSAPGSTSGGGGSALEEAALREALRLAKQERTALARQVREMDTDMNDLSKIQASMHRELEAAQQELRAKKHDFDLLVKQLIRMEEKEKKWLSDQPTAPVSPTKVEEAAERDDVARESLLVFTSSSATLLECLRRLQRVMAATGLEQLDAPPHDNSGRLGADPLATRTSGHRKSALSSTVSRAAMDHQRLSAQLADTLLPVLEKLEASAAASSLSLSAETTDTSKNSSGSGGSRRRDSAPVATQMRVVKQLPSGAAFTRIASTPASASVAEGHNASNGSFTAVRGATIASHGGTPKRGVASDAAWMSSATVTGSGGRAVVVDAAPRLDFHRQASTRAYTRSNTATAAAVPPPAADATSAGDTTTTTSSGGGAAAAGAGAGAATRNSGGERKEEKNAKEPRRASGGGGGAAGAPSHPRRHGAPPPTTATTATAKAAAFRRSNTTAGAAASLTKRSRPTHT
ncbi:hypothetical protein NESM_000413300 [Novymonas esmeraldas]|uniref:Flagellar attachment zone protein 1 conserved domain-containing protein n=1 Tax=Novymonas esmeraldas TaxID=1808958 RepID=A0AAW0ENG5_9TRYP